ncbi:MAG: MFS transporter [Actinobacteria bacterium]|nr:MFS transporter [Actinomycetota bacterium]MCB9412697.1 MFS transporter [Actinomycetota bacterium]
MLVVSLLIVVLDNTILNIALPTIQEDLQATQSELVWAVDSYILVFAALLFTWGVLGDKYGRKRILVIGLVVFAVASAASAFAPNAQALILFRGVMGVGGAAVLPVTLAIITVVFPPHERGRAIGLWAGAVGGAVALGPVLGGLMLQHPGWSSWLTGNDWGSVFLINVPIVIIGLIGILRVVPETRNPTPQRLDIPGLVMSFVGLVLLVYGIIHASETRSFLAVSVWLPMLAGVLVIALFLTLEARSDHRSFDVALFRNRGYAVSLTAVSLAFFALSGITFTLPFYLQLLRDFSTLQAGLCFLPFAAGQLLAAPRSAKLVNRFGYRKVMSIGLTIVGFALLGLARLEIDTPLWLVLTLFFLFGLGMGAVVAPASTVMQNVLPLARAGAGSAVQNTVRQVFGALGVAVISTLLATRFSSLVAPTIESLPAAIPQAARDAAQQSVGGATVVFERAAAAGVPEPVVMQWQSEAYQAFMSASHLTALVSAAMVLLAAVVVATLLPHIDPPRKQSDVAPASHQPDTVHEIAQPTEREAAAAAAELEQDYSAEAAAEYAPESKRDAAPDA